MSDSWTVDSGAVNAQGNVIVFEVTAELTDSNFSSTTLIDLSATQTDANASYPSFPHIGDIIGWRFSGASGAVKSADTPHIRKIYVFDAAKPELVAGSTYRFKFKFAILLFETGRIAINNAPGATYLDGFPSAGWVTLKWRDTNPMHVLPSAKPGPMIVAHLPFTADTVGRLPDAVATPHLKVHLDADAQYVKDGHTSTHLATWSALVGGPSVAGGPMGREPPLTAPGGVVAITFDGNNVTPNWANHFDGANPPLIQDNATIAAVFQPDSPSNISTIVGRYNSSNTSWRLGYDAPNASAIYESRDTSGVTVPLSAPTSQPTILCVFKRTSSTGDFWINGVPAGSGTPSSPVAAGGTTDLSVGARILGGFWKEGFKGNIDQVAAYDTNIDPLPLSLLMHQMADRALMTLGTPIPTAWQNQPYTVAGNRRLDRRPIAVVTLGAGVFDSNLFGQTAAWRSERGNAATADLEALKNTIRAAFNGCDQFEIMFNRPGGQYAADPVMTYVFGQANDRALDGDPLVDVITTNQWAAMGDLWTYFNLSDFSADAAIQTNADGSRYPQRRGWFYIGSGLPLNNDGTLNTTGYLDNRQVAPAIPSIYKQTILAPWTVKNPLYRCFMLDAGVVFFGKIVELVHDTGVNTNYTIAAEAIPTDNLSDPTAFPDQHAARLGAPWFAMAGYGSAPWWNLNNDNPPAPAIGSGYNANWTADWATTPTYFGVRDTGMLNLAVTDPSKGTPGTGDDLLLQDIYRWILKGPLPVAWSSSTYQKVGAAWNYATGRVLASRMARSPRLIRGARV